MIRRYFLLIVLTGYCLADDYFQQDVGYDIEVPLNDTDRTLTAFEKRYAPGLKAINLDEGDRLIGTIITNGEVVMTTGSTQPEIHVDVWCGNHPFFTGTQKILDTEGRVDRIMRKYGMSSSSDSSGESNPSKDQKTS